MSEETIFDNQFDVLQGLSFSNVVYDAQNEEIVFTERDSGKKYKMYHNQDCCESVRVQSIVGYLADLTTCAIEKVTVEIQEKQDTNYGSATFTTITLTNKANEKVVITWVGESNGYYSESVDFGECS